jgi:glycosyltransferase involved in cell wall biosynthesis
MGLEGLDVDMRSGIETRTAAKVMGTVGTFEHMARIALNGRLLVPGKMEGIGRFTLRCLEGLVALRPHDSFLLVVDRPDDALFHLGPNVEVRRIRIPARRPWLIRWWFGRPMSRVLRAWKADAFVSLEGPIATDMPSDFPQLSVIHDLNFEHSPEGLPSHWAHYYTSQFPKYARRADVLGTVSEYSRRDLESTYGLDFGSIHVFSNAADASFQPSTQDEVARAQKSYAEGRPYFVFVGSLHPRKNVEGLLAAFEMYCARGGSWDLVVVGVAMWSEALPTLSSEVAPRVHFVGRLQQEHLVLAVSGARGLVFVPWFEGFGIPLIEAMACGVPVIASNVTSLPEVCGGAAFALVNPSDTTSIAAEMNRLESDASAAREAEERGLRRAADFSWSATASKLSEALNLILPAS